jgi:hypothetical protein
MAGMTNWWSMAIAAAGHDTGQAERQRQRRNGPLAGVRSFDASNSERSIFSMETKRAAPWWQVVVDQASTPPSTRARGRADADTSPSLEERVQNCR